MTTDAIAHARAAFIDARLNLADAIREACPKPHAYVQHRDRQPPWCEACGYAEDGTRILVRLAAGLDGENTPETP